MDASLITSQTRLQPTFTRPTAAAEANGNAHADVWTSGYSTLNAPLNANQFAGLVNPAPAAVTVAQASAPGVEQADESRMTDEQKGRHGETGRRVAAGVALALTGLGVVGGMLATPTAAYAAPRQATRAQQAQQTRSQTPVKVSNIDEAVSQFNAGKQLYVVGNPALNGVPFTQADMQKFSNVLKNNPNVYIVLVDRTTNLERDDNTLSRGIANSAQFQSVVNPKTGERDGVVFMLYFNVNGDQNARKIFMRSEALPDKLGVGEENFAAADGQPLELMQLFINAVREDHKHVADALGVVMTRINSTIDQHAQTVAGSAEQAVRQAEAALTGIEPKIQQFQEKYGANGILGSPDVAGWRAQLASAKQALGQFDFATAQKLSSNVISAVETQDKAMAAYEQAPEQARQIRSQISDVAKKLKDLPNDEQGNAARASFRKAQSELEAYDTAYRAKDPAYVGHLEQAQAAIVDANNKADDAHESMQQRERIRNIVIASVTVAMLATATILHLRARKARKGAEKELQKAVDDIGARSKELLDLMNQADFFKVANYEGKTKAKADELMENVVDALTLVGGAEKFLAEAKTLVNAGGMGKITNLFLTRNYSKATGLLTDPEQKLTFSFSDSSRAVIEKNSHADTWREELAKRGTTREFQQSFEEVLLAMADRRDHAAGLVEELNRKSVEIGHYFERIETTAAADKKKAEELKTRAADGFFAAPAVLTNLLPRVSGTAEEGGLIAQGRKISDRNFVAAWDDYAVPAERLANEAGQILDVGVDARANLLPTLEAADGALHPHQVKTDWAHDQKRKLSDRLNDTANTALRTSVQGELKTLRTDLATLEARVKTVVQQDQERREVSPGLISGAEQDVDKTRQDLADGLHELGYFKQGKPDQVLREQGKDPSDLTKSAHSHLEAVKPRLDIGDIETAGQHLKSVRDLSQGAHDITAQSRAAVKAFPATLEERKQRHGAITGSIAGTYQPSLDRIKKTYASEVLQLVAPDVNAGDTIADNVKQAQDFLSTASGQTTTAVTDFDKAQVLRSRDGLAAADGSLKSAQSQLDSITKAEQLLASKQKAVEAELGQLEGRLSGTQSHAGANYVRSQARQLLRQAEQGVSRADSQVNGTPHNPYRAKEALDLAENQRTQCESAIEADRQAYESARSAIASAESSIASARATVSSCANESWSFSNSVGSCHTSVDASEMSGAFAALSGAESYLSAAHSEMSSQDYEGAQSKASQADSQADSAVSYAHSAVSSARSRHQRKVDELEREEQRRIEEERRRREEEERRIREEQERREAEARRQREEEERRNQQNNGGGQSGESGSGGGGWSGGGGSGSRGGSW